MNLGYNWDQWWYLVLYSMGKPEQSANGRIFVFPYTKLLTVKKYWYLQDGWALAGHMFLSCSEFFLNESGVCPGIAWPWRAFIFASSESVRLFRYPWWYTWKIFWNLGPIHWRILPVHGSGFNTLIKRKLVYPEAKETTTIWGII